MTLILIRHAHRDTTQREQDNGLSPKGKKQAKALLGYFKKRFGRKSADLVLMSSPKKRCVETLTPIARYLRDKILVSNSLTEQGPGESAADLAKRCRGFVAELGKGRHKTLIACSHGDWIPLVLEELCTVRMMPKKASWIEIEDGTLVRILEPEDL